jgi:hypothetical protein
MSPKSPSQAHIAAGKFRPFEGDTQLQPGISSVANYGHTPGTTPTWSAARASDS